MNILNYIKTAKATKQWRTAQDLGLKTTAEITAINAASPATAYPAGSTLNLNNPGQPNHGTCYTLVGTAFTAVDGDGNSLRLTANSRRAVGQSICWQQVQLSNGASLSTTYRLGFVAPRRMADIVLMFTNGSTGAVTQVGPGNPVTVTAGFEYKGVTYQVTWGGQTSVSIPDNKFVFCDPIPVDVQEGATYFVRSCPTVTAGQKWNNGVLGWSTGSVSAINTDLTAGTGALATALSGQSFENRGFGPSAILAITPPNKKADAVCIVADSIGAGTGDGTPTRTVAGRGFVVRGLGFTSNWMQQGIPSSRVIDRAVMTNIPSFSALYTYADYAVCNMSTNDLSIGSTVAQVQAGLISLWGNFWNRGVPVYQCTILPKTTSTNRWATAVNQTITSLGENNNRINLNTWLRDGAPVDSSWSPLAAGTTAGAIRAGNVAHPLAGHIETANVVEVNSSGVLTQNGGFWLTGGVSDSGTFTSWANSPYTATDTTKTWSVNQHAGKVCHITSGTGAGAYTGIVSNTVDGLVFNSISTVLDATSTYQIIDAMTQEGIHPSIKGHIALAAPIAAWKAANSIGN